MSRTNEKSFMPEGDPVFDANQCILDMDSVIL